MAGNPQDEPRVIIPVTIRVRPNEAKALAKLARMQRLSRSQVLRMALEAYARNALAFEEYRELYPLE
jgi:predicted transcriptional regulator